MMKECIKPSIKILNTRIETLMSDISNTQGGEQLGKENLTDGQEAGNSVWKS